MRGVEGFERILIYLQEFYCSFNNIKILPPEIGQCIHLEKLACSNNLIKKIPHEVAKLDQLSTLNISANKVRFLPPDLGHMPSLQNLDVSSNPLCKEIDHFARKGKKELLKYLATEQYEEFYYEKT